MRLDPRKSIVMMCSTEVRVTSLIGCFSPYFRAQVTTNQRRQTDLCKATSSVWNFWSPVSVVSQTKGSELAKNAVDLNFLLSFCHSSRAVTEMLEKNYKIHCSLNDIVRNIT